MQDMIFFVSATRITNVDSMSRNYWSTVRKLFYLFRLKLEMYIHWVRIATAINILII